MLWLGMYFPLMPLECFALGKDTAEAKSEASGQPKKSAQSASANQQTPLVISQTIRQVRQVICCNQAAAAAGIKIGHTVSTALTLSQSLVVRKRSIEAERTMLEAVAIWAYQYSDAIVIVPPACVLLEVEASLKLFKSIEGLLQHMQQHWQDVNLTVETSLALTPLVATYLPQYFGVSFQRLRQLIQQTPLDILKADIDRFSRKLPIDILPVKDNTKSELQLLGLYSIDDMSRLPRAELMQRFGSQLSQWLDQLLGDKPDPQQYFQMPLTFQHQLELAAQVNDAQQLLFPIKRQLGLLKNYLIQRQKVCRRLDFVLDQRPQGIPSPIEISVQISQGTAKTEQFLELIKLKLEQVQLADMVIAITLKVEQFESPKQPSQDLLDNKGSNEDFEHILDRISAKLGANTLKQLLPHADHRPEYSYQTSAYLNKPNTQPQWQALNPRPNWLLPHPEPLNALGHNPCYQGGPLTLHSEAERIDTGWWDGAACFRDYYIAQSQSGSWLWIYFERSLKQWFVHGFFS